MQDVEWGLYVAVSLMRHRLRTVSAPPYQSPLPQPLNPKAIPTNLKNKYEHASHPLLSLPLRAGLHRGVLRFELSASPAHTHSPPQLKEMSAAMKPFFGNILAGSLLFATSAFSFA
ncbi:MAG TPA: hypothetical protein VIM60_03535, partial [Edaphobacter sp.]